MSRPSISVAMATFNGGSFLEPQLESLAEQSVLPDELVVCDDGSDDGTLGVLQDFTARAPFPVRIERNTTRLGYKANFMKSASLCSSDAIAFADQDDIWLAGKVAALQEAFGSESCIAVTHDYSVMFEDGRSEIPSYFAQLARNNLSPATSIKGCTMAYRRTLTNRFGWPPPESGWGHDSWIAAISTALGARVFLREPLIRHRIHGVNASGWLIERSRAARWLGKLQLRFLTGYTDMDELICHCVEADAVGDLVRVVDSADSGLPTARRGEILVALARKQDIAAFRCSGTYLRAVPRAVMASRLFLSGHYSVADGVPGVLSDFFGRWLSVRG